MKDIVNKFNSVGSFASYLQTAKVNKVFGGELLASEYQTESACTTKSYEEACNLMINGDTSNYEKITAAKVKINKTVEAVVKKTVYSVCGSSVSVGAFLSGSPNCMRRRQNMIKGSKILNIYFDTTVDCHTTTEDIIDASSVVLSAIEDVERKGFRVNLFACLASQTFQQKLGAAVKIKDSGTPFNRLKVAYFMVNPSFLRRHMLRYTETAEGELSKYFVGGYGSPVANRSEVCKLFGIKDSELIKLTEIIGKDKREIINRFESGLK